MTPEQTIVINLVTRCPLETALTLWVKLLQATETFDDMKLIKSLFPNQDETIRKILARLEESGVVKSRIRKGSILREWTLA